MEFAERRVGTVAEEFAELQERVNSLTAEVRELTQRMQFDPPERFSTGGRGTNSTRLIRVNEGFCALTRITGDLNGNGEWARIRPRDNGFWYLETRSRRNSGAGAWVSADVDCWRFPTGAAEPE